MTKNTLVLSGRVREAFEAAKRASEHTYREFLKTWPLMEDGKSRVASGLVSITVHGTRKLKAVFLRQGLATPWRGLYLGVHDLGAPEQGITAQERASQAACDVLNAKIGDLGQFRVESRLD